MTELPVLEVGDVQRALVVVAHPDDAEYGISALAHAWSRAGVEVTYVLMSRGEAGISTMPPAETAAVRAEEQRRACERVGARLVMLDHPDGLLEPGLGLRRDIAREIRRTRPQVVVITTWEVETSWGLNHVDHRVTGLATVDAARDADNPWVFPELVDEEGLTPWGITWLLVAGTTPDAAIALGREDVEAAVDSLRLHEAYLEALPGHPDPGEFLPEMLTGAGQRAGVDFALPVRAVRMRQD